MNNTTIGILIGIALFGVVAVIVFQDEGPPRVDFHEIISDEEEVAATSSEESEEVTQEAEAGTVDTSTDAADETGVEPEMTEETVSSGDVEEDTTTEEGAGQSEEVEGVVATTTEEEVINEEQGSEEQTATSTSETTSATTTDEAEENEGGVAAPSDLMMHIPFDETGGSIASDISGHGNFGTLLSVDTEIAWNGGAVDGALFLDGQNDHVAISHSETLNLGAQTQSYSISFWFRSTNDPGGEREIIGKGGRSGSSPFDIRINSEGEVSFRVSDGFAASTLRTDVSIVNGSWNHVVALRDVNSDRLRLYINGIVRGGITFDQTNESLRNALPVYINRYELAGNAYAHHNFGIDDLYIYNRKLETNEITELFKARQ